MKLAIILFVVACSAFLVDAGLAGGLTPVKDLKSLDEYKPLIEKTYNLKTNEEHYGLVLKIESAETQVIAGQRLVIRFTLAKTDCKKDEVSKGLKSLNKDCKHTKVIERCIADVIIRAWEKFIDVSQMKCNDVVTDYYKE